MQDLINQIHLSSFWWVPAITFAIGIIGSPHCLSMCGGLVLIHSNSKKQLWAYHLGRLSGYLLIVSLFAVVGVKVIQPLLPSAKWFSGIFLSTVFLLVGVKLLGFKIPRLIPSSFSQFLYKKSYQVKFVTLRSFFAGAATIFLPCGLSYSVFLALLAIGLPSLSLLATVTFWSGTVPALVWGPRFVRKLNQALNPKIQKVAGLAIVLLGLYSVYQRVDSPLYENLNSSEKAPTCH